jgi:hypothetical protein
MLSPSVLLSWALVSNFRCREFVAQGRKNKVDSLGAACGHRRNQLPNRTWEFFYVGEGVCARSESRF